MAHRVTKEKRGYLIERSPESIRSTQLFRTLLHELGHYVDWMANKIELALETDDEAEEAWIDQTYDTKPTATKEDFAHRYAAEMAERVPRFPPCMDYDSLRADGLDPEWFRRR